VSSVGNNAQNRRIGDDASPLLENNSASLADLFPIKSKTNGKLSSIITKAYNFLWRWSHCVCWPPYQCAVWSMSRGREIWFQSIVRCWQQLYPSSCDWVAVSELETVWKEAVVANLTHYCSTLLKILRTTTKRLVQCLKLDSKK